MRVVVAPDKFKGTLTATAFVDAAERALSGRGATVIGQPLADGGDGTLDAFGGPNRTTCVTGPLGEPVEAPWRLRSRVAVIEMAAASGLVLAGGPEQNQPLDATTRGTGELIATAVSRGARRVIVGAGGSATTDGGLGAIEAIGSPVRLAGVELSVATDVRTSFTDAAAVFGPQKGASKAQVAFLEARLQGLAERYMTDFGVDVRGVEGAGAAGGLAGGLHALGAEIVSGFELIAEMVQLDQLMADADLVVTGEGSLDATSFDGKVVGGVIELAEEFDCPVLVVVGQITDDVATTETIATHSDRVRLVSLAERFGTARAMEDPGDCIAELLGEHPLA